MSLFKKMAFWKTAPDSVLSEPAELPAQDFESSKPLPHRFSPLSEGFEPSPAFAQQMSSPAPQQSNFDAELRVISAKLDTIKAVLEVINQRLDRLEGKKEEINRWR